MGLGAEMVRAEFTDAGSLAAALGGVNSVFAMTTPFEAGVDAETAQGVALVDAAASAGVDHESIPKLVETGATSVSGDSM